MHCTMCGRARRFPWLAWIIVRLTDRLNRAAYNRLMDYLHGDDVRSWRDALSS